VLTCLFVAVIAVALSVTVFRDPHAQSRRVFLRQCHEQAYDKGVADHCDAEAQARYGSFNTAGQNVAFIIAAGALTAGTFFVLLYVVREVGGAVGQRG
jgi:hypothetical protein